MSSSPPGPRRDFADVVRRARLVDPSRIPGEPLGQAGELDAMDLDEPGTDARDPGLEPFVQSARRLLREPPTAGAGRSHAPRLILGAVLSAAATVAIISLAGWHGAAIWRDGPTSASQSEYSTRAPGRQDGRGAPRLNMGPAPKAASAQKVAEPPATARPAVAEVEGEGGPAESGVLDAQSHPAAPSRKRYVAKTDRDLEQARLDDAAQAAWRAGNLRQSERLFRELISVAPRSARAETAYGDLITLLHQRGDPKLKRRVERKYLRSFSKGQFAEDVRASLCRSASSAQRECWQDYLDHHPAGAYRREAQRAVDEADAPDGP